MLFLSVRSTNMPDAATIELISQNAEHTFRLGRALGELLTPGDVICLSGNLGAGKTVFTKGIGAGWGALEVVTSPTFTLIHEHRRARDRQVLYHIDCYRLQGPGDAWGIGMEDLLLGENPVVIEWPENIQDVVPQERLWVAIQVLDETQRHMTWHAAGERYRAYLDTLRLALLKE
jgi:tRNA threonylcarbamoyladenosine biosynthesis protein TsaE